jgi:hypothetical protein
MTLGVIATAVIGVRHVSSPPRRSAQQVKAWTLQPAAAGMIFTWNRSARELRDAARVDLILHDGIRQTTHMLDRDTGALVIPYTPQSAVMTADGRRIVLYGSEPHAPSRPEFKSERNTGPRPQRLDFPMLLSIGGRRVVSTAAVILPRVPRYVHRPIDIELLLKVDPHGRITNVASNYGHDPLRNRLSAVAADAVSKWQFDRIAVTSYREGRIVMLFTPQGMSVEPAPDLTRG